MKDFSSLGISVKKISQLCGLTTPGISKVAKRVGTMPIDAPSVAKYSISDTRKITSDCFASKHPIEKKIHVFYNFKGGVGKTTMAYQVSSHLALLGYKVLVIDIDPQHNLTSSFGFYEGVPETEIYRAKTLYDSVARCVPLDQIIHPIYEGLDLIPSNITLTRLESELFTKNRREEQLLDIIKIVEKDYDFIMIDASPNISNLNLNALNAADVVHIICETQKYSFSSTGILIDEIHDFFEKRMKKEPPYYHIVPNKYTGRSTVSGEVISMLVSVYSGIMRPNFAVRQSEDFNRSNKENLPLIFFCKFNSPALMDVVEFIDEVVYISSSAEANQKTA